MKKGEKTNEKIITSATIKSVPTADIYVSTEGNDETGDVSANKPYLSVLKAITMAKDENKIYIMPGEYNLGMAPYYYSKEENVGITDYGKALEIFGEYAWE